MYVLDFFTGVVKVWMLCTTEHSLVRSNPQDKNKKKGGIETYQLFFAYGVVSAS